MQSGVKSDRHAQVKAVVAVLPDRCPSNASLASGQPPVYRHSVLSSALFLRVTVIALYFSVTKLLLLR